MKRCPRCGRLIDWTYGGHCWDCWSAMANQKPIAKPNAPLHFPTGAERKEVK